ncbi:MAG: LysR family transcriptional regulator [Bdellovibrionaceae bacterium]|nr:LysR family transcriptional regulator [Bdellovibrionales bacterium]MCB9085794.1 LysR family transcriptional regulator [Pseudobdellovibrionaceae bacterium]
MNLQQLTTFCTVLSEGSMTAAADKLFLTQPAVSQQIRNLEEELAVDLLVRGVRQVKPTLQGQMLYDYAKRILFLTQQAEVAIKTMSQEMSGYLKIGTLNSLGLYMISPIVGMFLKHNSRLQIKLVYGSGEKIISEMRNKNVNIAILPDLKKEYGIEFEHFDKRFLFKDEMWLVGSGRDTSIPNHIEVKDFATRPIISFSEKYPSFRMMVEKKLQEAGVNPVTVFESDNVGTLKRVIESGLGWGFLPAHSIRKQVKTNRMTQIEIEEVKYMVNVNLYSQKGSEIEPMVDVFYRALQQQGIK